MASLLHVGGMQPNATGSGCVPLVVGYAWDGGRPIAAMSGLVEDWFRGVGGARWDDALLATPLYEHRLAELHEDASANVREHPLASAARSCANLAAVRCGRPRGFRCRPGGGHRDHHRERPVRDTALQVSLRSPSMNWGQHDRMNILLRACPPARCAGGGCRGGRVGCAVRLGVRVARRRPGRCGRGSW